jgi:predicted DNA-binding ribbon-helix-helix protein
MTLAHAPATGDRPAGILHMDSARFAVALPDGVRFVTLEARVRDELDRIADRHGLTVDRLCARIAARTGADTPLCAAIRAFVAGYRHVDELAA